MRLSFGLVYYTTPALTQCNPGSCVVVQIWSDQYRSHCVVVQHRLSVHTRAHKLCAHWMGAANCRLQWLGCVGCVGTQERQIGVSKGACLEWLGWDGNKGALSFQLSIGLSQPYDQEHIVDWSDFFSWDNTFIAMFFKEPAYLTTKRRWLCSFEPLFGLMSH